MTKKTSPAYRASKEETIPINKLHPFSNHPFHIRHDLEFSELVDSIRGVTLHLPQNGIERLFIPEKYVLRDLDAGQCTVLLYPNLQYSYVPIGDSKKRLNIQGDRLSEFLGSSINLITESTGLKRKIAAIERRAGIENAKFLGKMLQGMTDSRIHTTGDYDKVIHNLGKTQIGLTNELAEVKQK